MGCESFPCHTKQQRKSLTFLFEKLGEICDLMENNINFIRKFIQLWKIDCNRIVCVCVCVFYSDPFSVLSDVYLLGA